jgi:hypothetical protein
MSRSTFAHTDAQEKAIHNQRRYQPIRRPSPIRPSSQRSEQNDDERGPISQRQHFPTHSPPSLEDTK